LRDIRKVTTEIYLTPGLPYQGAVNHSDFSAFMYANGFVQSGAKLETVAGRHGDFTFVQAPSQLEKRQP
jgi:hypothetical protein